jgi:hypothetical protein
LRERFTTTTFCLTNYDPSTDYDGGGAGSTTDIGTFLGNTNATSTAPAGYTIGSATQVVTGSVAQPAGAVHGPNCP